MSTLSTNPQGRNDQATRLITFTQSIVDPETSNGGTNPFGNTIRIKFPYQQSFNSCDVALANLFLFNSWYNITSTFGNNTFQYAFPTAAGYQTFTVTIPDGNYTLDELNQFFQQIQTTNGTYLINTTTGLPTYFLFWITNFTYYRTTLFSNPIPANGTGYTVPSNYPGGGPPTTAQDPSLIIINVPGANAGATLPGRYSFGTVIGFSPGAYPIQSVASTGVAQSYNGQFAPVIESTSSVSVSCSLANNSTINNNPQSIYRFSPNVDFGSQIQLNPPYPLFLPVADGFYQTIEVTLYDDNNRLLSLQDPHLSGTLIVRGK